MFLCLREKRSCFWLGAKKKSLRRGENHSPPPAHVSSGPSPINGKPVKVDHSQLIQDISIKQCFVNL